MITGTLAAVASSYFILAISVSLGKHLTGAKINDKPLMNFGIGYLIFFFTLSMSLVLIMYAQRYFKDKSIDAHLQ